MDGITPQYRSPLALVLFSNGGHSSRFSPYNLLVARRLNRLGIATCLLDPAPDADSRRGVFGDALERLASRPQTAALPVGLAGSGDGTQAALQAAADHPEQIRVLLCRGGTVETETAGLSQVRCPALFLIEGDPSAVVAVGRRLNAPYVVESVAGPLHLFHGATLPLAARMASSWFCRFLPNRESLTLPAAAAG